MIFDLQQVKCRAEKYLLPVCNAAAILLFAYIACDLLYLAGLDVMNRDAAVIVCCAKNLAHGINVVTGSPAYFSVSTGTPVLLPVAVGIRLFGNTLAVPHLVMAVVNLLLLVIVLVLPFRYGFLERKYWGAYTLIYLLFYFFFPCSDRATVWYYTPLGELPTVLYLQIAVLILFSDFNQGSLHRKTLFGGGVVLGLSILCKDLGLLPLFALCGSWFWLRCRCLPWKNWRRIAGDCGILLAGILLVPFLWQLLLLWNLDFSFSAFWQGKVEFLRFFRGMSAQHESFWEHLVSRYSYYRIVDGDLWALLMAVYPLYLAVRFLFVKVYEKRHYVWTLFFAGYSIYCYWLFFDALNHSRRLLMGHIFFVAAAAMFLFSAEKRYLKVLLFALVAFNPQIRNAFRELSTFDRPDFVQESREAGEAVKFCLDHADAHFTDVGYGLGSYLISYLHPAPGNIITDRPPLLDRRNTYCIMEARYISFYEDKIPGGARWINPQCRFWRIYDYSLPPAKLKTSLPGDLDGDGITEIIACHQEKCRVLSIDGKRKYREFSFGPWEHFAGTGDVDGNGKEEIVVFKAQENDPQKKVALFLAAKNALVRVACPLWTIPEKDISVFSGYWDGTGDHFIVQHSASGRLELCRGRNARQNVPGCFNSVWKLVAYGDFAGDYRERMLFYCQSLNRYYLFDTDGSYREVNISYPPLACGPGENGKETLFFALPAGQGIMTMQGKTLQVPAPWRVVAAGVYMPGKPMPQLLLVHRESRQAALRLGTEPGTLIELDWKIPASWRIWNRIFFDQAFQ